jgi:23S rRNA (cytosine1962-C5)-methyltransferase
MPGSVNRVALPLTPGDGWARLSKDSLAATDAHGAMFRPVLEDPATVKLPVVVAAPAIRRSLAQGHPWVYRNQVVPLRGHATPPRLPTGTWVRVLCGPFEGVGLWDAEGAIAVRVFPADRVPDEAWLSERVRAAYALRAPIRDWPPEGRETTAYRWVFGESDGLPGVVVDLYDRWAAVELYSQGLDALLEPLLAALRSVAPLEGIVLRRAGSPDGGGSPCRVETVWGRRPPEDLVIRENGLSFYVNLTQGQKTGFFLDHRENRAAVEPWCRERTAPVRGRTPSVRDAEVLNAFSYTGAFTVYALRGGAAHVTSVDIAPASAPETRRNLELNGMDPARCTCAVADCFDWLAHSAREGRQFDVAILDPPSLARDKASRHAAARAYTRLNALAMRCLRPGGVLATASCTSQVSPDMFRDALAAAAAQAGRRLLVLHEAGHALDHPMPVHFPEARYLKFVLGRVMEP